jgi:hypothetical protein
MKRVDVGAVLRPADVLILVPPFASIGLPALGVHILQGVARLAVGSTSSRHPTTPTTTPS